MELIKRENYIELEFIGKLTEGYEEDIYIGEDNLIEMSSKYLNGKMVMVSYLISREDLTKNQFIEKRLEYVHGQLDVKSSPVYGSEYTGFMWNDNKFKVGDHDILSNLESYMWYNQTDAYCYLSIKLHDRENIINELLD
jgi:hypothetical protein